MCIKTMRQTEIIWLTTLFFFGESEEVNIQVHIHSLSITTYAGSGFSMSELYTKRLLLGSEALQDLLDVR